MSEEYEMALIEGWDEYLPFTPPDWLAIGYGYDSQLCIYYPVNKYEELSKILENVSYYHPLAECIISCRRSENKDTYIKVLENLKELRKERFTKFLRKKILNSDELTEIIDKKISQRFKEYSF